MSHPTSVLAEQPISLGCRFGVLAPNARLRAAVVPDVVQPASESAHEHAYGQAAWMSWARLLKRMFDIDVEHWACGGELTIIAAIEDPIVIVRILTHPDLPARARTPAPACALQSMQTA